MKRYHMDFGPYKKNISRFLENLGVSYKTTNSGEYVFDECFFCGKKKKLYYNPQSTLWHCFTCEQSGNIVHLISKIQNISSRRALEKIQGGTVVRQQKKLFDSFIFNQEKSEPDSIPAVTLPVEYQNFSFSKNHVEEYKRFYLYLVKRGITKAMVKYFNVMFSNATDRIIFPIYYNKEIVGWQGRAINDIIKPKALTNPVSFKKSQVLFNYDNVKNSEYITIVEGPIDACKSFKHNPVAILGKSLSDAQVELIREMPNLKKIYDGLDPDAGREKLMQSRKLSAHFEIYSLNIMTGDVGERSTEEVDALIKNSSAFNRLNFFDFSLA